MSLPLLASIGGWQNFLPGFRAPLAAGVLSGVFVLVLTPLVMRLAVKHGAVDDPTRDERRVHTQTTPRWGGIAIYAAIVLALAAILPFAFPVKPFPPYLAGILIAGALIVVMGAFDDLRQYSAKIQLGYLLVAGIGVQFLYDGVGRVQIQGITVPAPGPGTGWLDFGVWAVPLTAVYIFVVTKTMDTIDGIDGLAGGIAAIAATTLSVIATLEGQPRVALIALAIAGASIGFLRYNFNPAKVFMGTGGAQGLGFMLASLSIVGAMKTAATLAVLIPMLVFAVPLFDAGFVVVRRILSRQPITQPDKRHLHHTLLGKGFTQRQAVWILYLAAIGLSGLMMVLVKKLG